MNDHDDHGAGTERDGLTGLPIPDPTTQVPNGTLLRAAGAAGSHGHTQYGAILRTERTAQAVTPHMVAVQQLPDPDIRRYTLPALLRSKLTRHVTVLGGRTPKGYRKQLTMVGRQIAEAISSIYGVFYVTVSKHELDVYLSASFTWSDDFAIHEQIMAIIKQAVESPTGDILLLRELSLTDTSFLADTAPPGSDEGPPDSMAV
jgi:hypothetical protein